MKNITFGFFCHITVKRGAENKTRPSGAASPRSVGVHSGRCQKATVPASRGRLPAAGKAIDEVCGAILSARPAGPAGNSPASQVTWSRPKAKAGRRSPSRGR